MIAIIYAINVVDLTIMNAFLAIIITMVPFSKKLQKDV